MDERIELEAQHTWDRLVSALLRLGCLKTELDGNELYIYEPECSGMFYDRDRTVVILAVDRSQLQPDRVREIDRGKSRAVLKGYLGSRVETVPVNGTLYFRVPVQVSETAHA